MGGGGGGGGGGPMVHRLSICPKALVGLIFLVQIWILVI